MSDKIKKSKGSLPLIQAITALAGLAFYDWQAARAKPRVNVQHVECDPDQLDRIRQGVDVWNAWREQDPLARINLRNADLSGLPLDGVNLGGSENDQVRLDGANFARSSLRQAIFNKASLRSASFERAILARAWLQDADLSNADLSRSDLTGTHCWRTNFENAKVISVKFLKREMIERFFGVRGIQSCWGDATFKRAAADADYLYTLRWHWNECWPKRMLFKAWWLIDYGRSVFRVFLLAFAFVLFFGLVYSLEPGWIGLDCIPTMHPCMQYSWFAPFSFSIDCSPTCPRFDLFTPFYFSIVTFTTLGFGDIAAKSLAGEIAVSFEVVLGYLVLGLLVSVFAEKIARRS